MQNSLTETAKQNHAQHRRVPEHAQKTTAWQTWQTHFQMMTIGGLVGTLAKKKRTRV
jgi:hypothetical protein